jgi:hypothetical protein
MKQWIPKKFVISVVSATKPKNILVFAFTCVMETFAMFFSDFYMESYTVDSDEVMKRWNDAMKHLTVHRFNF